MPRLQSVLFDLDGTLLDSAPDIAQALNKMLAENGREGLPVDTVKTFIGDGAMETCRRALKATGGVPGDDLFPYVQRFILNYRSLPPDPAQIFPGVPDMLSELNKAGVKLAVCTNKQEAATKGLLDQLSLLRYFAFIAGGDTFPVHKPHPGHITGILEALEANRTGAVFVGDGPNDTRACERAGIPCVVVTHGYGQDYDSLKADAKIADAAALLPKLREMGWDW